MFKYVLVTLILFQTSSAYAQKWLPGHFTDSKGNVETGELRVNPSAKGPVKEEGFIEFKENDKSNPFKLSASELQSFVIGRDSFIVAHPPGAETWPKNEFDFVKVALNEDVKLYVTGSGGGSGKGGHGIGFSPEIATGIGTGGYGSGFAGGVSIPITIGGGGGGEGTVKTAWYYGPSTAEMKRLTDQNFEDVMSDMMGDEPEVVEKIHAKVYILENVDRLVTYFKQVKAAHK